MDKSLLDKINYTNLPQHIAIIMDGNGRWAKRRLMPRTIGHRAGMKTLKSVVRLCSDINIPVLTVYAFSTENWKRPQREIDFLMDLLIEYLYKELAELHANKVQIRVLGDISMLPAQVQTEICRSLDQTKDNTGLIFNLALNYGARAELVEAAKKIAYLVQTHQINLDSIGESTVSKFLYTGELPDPDLLIRTAGDMRISNFLLWQIAYSEIIVTNTLWPDFTEDNLLQAIIEFQNRERRFGGLSPV